MKGKIIMKLCSYFCLILFSCVFISGCETTSSQDRWPALQFEDDKGHIVALKDFSLQNNDPAPVVTMIWCTTCVSCRSQEYAFQKLKDTYGEKVRFLAVSSNANENQAKVKKFLKQKGLNFEVVYDRKGIFAKHFKITQTTTTLVFNLNGKLVYRGRFADRKTNKTYVSDALGALLANKEITVKTTKDYG